MLCRSETGGARPPGTGAALEPLAEGNRPS